MASAEDGPAPQEQAPPEGGPLTNGGAGEDPQPDGPEVAEAEAEAEADGRQAAAVKGKQPARAEPENNLYITNIPLTKTRSQYEVDFQRFGFPIEECTILHKDGVQTLHGLVRFKDAATARTVMERAKRLRAHADGFPYSVRLAYNQKEKDERMRQSQIKIDLTFGINDAGASPSRSEAGPSRSEAGPSRGLTQSMQGMTLQPQQPLHPAPWGQPPMHLASPQSSSSSSGPEARQPTIWITKYSRQSYSLVPGGPLPPLELVNAFPVLLVCQPWQEVRVVPAQTIHALLTPYQRPHILTIWDLHLEAALFPPGLPPIEPGDCTAVLFDPPEVIFDVIGHTPPGVATSFLQRGSLCLFAGHCPVPLSNVHA